MLHMHVQQFRAEKERDRTRANQISAVSNYPCLWVPNLIAENVHLHYMGRGPQTQTSSGEEGLLSGPLVI